MIEEVKNIINNTDEKISFKSCLILYGNSGIGKTYRINKILEDSNMEIIKFTTKEINNSKELEDKLTKTITVKNFMSIISQKEIKKKIILIDDYDELLALDRTINNTIYNILNIKKIRNIGILIISSNELLKKLGNMKKKCKCLEIKKYDEKELYQILKKLKNIDDKLIKLIIKKIDGNIYQGKYYLENIKLINNDNINIDKEYDINYLYGTEYNKEIVNKILYTDTWLVPLRFHENLIKELDNRKISILNKIKYYKKFIYDMCFFDIYMSGSIDIAINIISYYVYNLTELEKKKDVKSNLDNFTKLLSYLSLQKKYIKKSFEYNSEFYQIGTYHINSININLYS